MSRIDIRHAHSLPKAKARKAIEEVAKKLAEKFDMDYDWDGDTLNFSRSGVEGAIELAAKDLHVHAKLGFLGWLLLVRLAITSTWGWIKRIGRRWARLHLLV